MSQRKLNSDYQNVDQSENQERRSRSRPTPIACIVCDMVFFDNVSLVLHFRCHLPGKISIPGQHRGDLASLRSEGPLSLSLSPYSSPSVDRINETASPRVNNCFRPSPLPVSSAKPDLAPTDANPFVMNPMPPINSSFDARFIVPQPIRCSVMSGMSLYGSTSSSTHPLMYSQLGPRTFSYGPRPAPHLRFPEQNAGQARFHSSRIPSNNQPEEPVLIVLSDSDEEGGENSAEEIDLTLKL